MSKGFRRPVLESKRGSPKTLALVARMRAQAVSPSPPLQEIDERCPDRRFPYVPCEFGGRLLSAMTRSAKCCSRIQERSLELRQLSRHQWSHKLPLTRLEYWNETMRLDILGRKPKSRRVESTLVTAYCLVASDS